MLRKFPRQFKEAQKVAELNWILACDNSLDR